MPGESKKLALRIAEVLEDRKALDVKILDIHSLTVMTDYFVIASGRTEIQVRALCDEVNEKLGNQGFDIKRREGYRNGRWIVMDYGDVILHIFHQDEREFYNLERLWDEGIHLSVDNP